MSSSSAIVLKDRLVCVDDSTVRNSHHVVLNVYFNSKCIVVSLSSTKYYVYQSNTAGTGM